MNRPYTEKQIKALADARKILVEHFDCAGIIVGQYDGDAVSLNCVYGGSEKHSVEIGLLALRDGAERMIHEIDVELETTATTE